jgi:Helix-turn-helix domain
LFADIRGLTVPAYYCLDFCTILTCILQCSALSAYFVGAEVALGIGRTSLYELVKSGELKLIKIAGRTLVPRSELERLTSADRAA